MTNNEIDKPKFYTAEEVAKVLKCSVSTIRNFTKCGQLHPVRLGSRYCYESVDVDALLATGTDELYKDYMARKHAAAKARAEAKKAAGTLAEPHATLRVRRTLACLWEHHGRLAEAAEGHLRAAGATQNGGRAGTRAELVQGLADAFRAALEGVPGLDYVNWRTLAFSWLEAFEGGRNR